MASDSRQGQAALLVVLNLLVMFAVMGLAVDVGMGEFRKHTEQAAADAAAMAAAAYAGAHSSSCSSGITCGVVTNCTVPGSASNAFDAGCLYANANGYSNGGKGGTQTVTIKANNTASPVTGNSPSLWFQVTITESYPTLFGRFGGNISSFSITAQAVSGVTTSGGASCVYALSQTGTGFTDSGSGNLTLNSCGFYDNSNFSYSGSGNITAQSIAYAGTYSNSGSGTLSPTPTHSASFVSDPFSGVTAPTVSATCNNTNFSISDASAHTLTPGVYCGGLSISGSGPITFSSGVYIINGTTAEGTSFTDSGASSLTGTGVTFFITGKNGYSAGPIQISGSGSLTFSAPTSGATQGLLFFQDPSVTYAANNTYSGSGNVTGSLYFPTTTLSYSGSGSASYMALVANKIILTGSGNFTKDTTGTYTGLVKTTSSLLQ